MQQSLQLTSNHLSEEEYCLFSSLLPLSQLTDVIQAALFGCLRSAVPNICNENVSPKVSPKNKTEIRKIDTLTRQQKLFLMRSQGNVGTLKGPHEPVNHSLSHVAFLHTSFSCSLNSIKAVCVCVCTVYTCKLYSTQPLRDAPLQSPLPPASHPFQAIGKLLISPGAFQIACFGRSGALYKASIKYHCGQKAHPHMELHSIATS